MWQADRWPGADATARADEEVNRKVKRPYRVPGFGWILAAIVLVVALLSILHVAIPVLADPYVLILLLALAILL